VLFVPFVLKVLLKSEAVNVVTWFWTPSSTVAELKAFSPWLSCWNRVACAPSWSECRSKPPRLAKKTWRVRPSCGAAPIILAIICSWLPIARGREDGLELGGGRRGPS
jgi:hypothetical protein